MRITKAYLREAIKQLIKEQYREQAETDIAGVTQRIEQSLSDLQKELLPILQKYFYQLHDLKKDIKDQVNLSSMDSEGKIHRISDELRRLIKMLRKL